MAYQVIFSRKKKVNQKIKKLEKYKITYDVFKDKVELEIEQDFSLLPEKVEIFNGSNKLKSDFDISSNKIKITFSYVKGDLSLILFYAKELQVIVYLKVLPLKGL